MTRACRHDPVLHRTFGTFPTLGETETEGEREREGGRERGSKGGREEIKRRYTKSKPRTTFRNISLVVQQSCKTSKVYFKCVSSPWLAAYDSFVAMLELILGILESLLRDLWYLTACSGFSYVFIRKERNRERKRTSGTVPYCWGSPFISNMEPATWPEIRSRCKI